MIKNNKEYENAVKKLGDLLIIVACTDEFDKEFETLSLEVYDYENVVFGVFNEVEFQSL